MKILKFSASWCGPCKVLGQFLKDNADKIPYPIEEIDIEENMDLSVKYNVRSVPTMVLVDDTGKEVKRNVGVIMEDAKLQEFLA